MARTGYARRRLLMLASSVFLLAAAAGPVCAQTTESADGSQGLSLFYVNVSTTSFNPSLGETVSLTYSLSRSAAVTVSVFDADFDLVATVVSGISREAGQNEEKWDGTDENGRIVEMIDHLGIAAAINYVGDQQVATDRLGHTTIVTYSETGLPLSSVNALGDETIYTYDADDNVTSITDPLGNTQSYV